MNDIFYDITDFYVERNWKQALVFYVIYLAFVIALGAIVGVLTVVMAHQLNIDPALAKRLPRISGEIGALLCCLTLSILILRSKKISGIKSILFILGTLALSLIGGLGGLIIPSFLTTLENEPRAEEADSLVP